MEENNNINLCGYQFNDVNIDDKFKIFADIMNFKRGTIENSYYENELILIPDTNLGVFKSIVKDYRISEVEKFTKTVETFGYPQYEEKEYFKIKSNDSLKEFVENKKYKEEIQKWFDNHVTKNQLDEFNNRAKELHDSRIKNFNHYYEIEFPNGCNGKIYLENSREKEAIYIVSNEKGFNIELGNIMFDTEYNTFFGNILDYMIRNRELVNDIRKIENGYVFNNKYYESIEDISYEIEEIIKNKKLFNKFNNEGISLDDIR